jgi:hypothetical protein
VSVHTNAELERLNRAARREFSHALMSDTKWRKLFAILAEGELGLRQMLVKLIEVAEPRIMAVPPPGAAHTPWPYIDTIELGPLEFRAIEWLELPAVARFPRPNHVPAQEVPQDLDRVEAALAGAGKYPLERSGEALRVIGYSR